MLMFLKTARLSVLMGCPRSVLRPTPAYGVPTTWAAVGSLWIQCALVMGVTPHWFCPPPLPKHGSVKLTSVPRGRAVPPAEGQVARVPSQYCPTDAIGRLALLRMGRHASNVPPKSAFGSQRLPVT